MTNDITKVSEALYDYFRDGVPEDCEFDTDDIALWIEAHKDDDVVRNVLTHAFANVISNVIHQYP